MTPPINPTPAPPDSPVGEGRYHTYRTHAIPIVVHLSWVLFWIGAVYYLVNFLLPALRVELVNPP